MTVLDLLTDPSLLRDANACFVNVRQAPSAYDPLLSADGKPALDLNIDIMSRIRESMETYYYDPSRYASYLEQLGIEYPGLKAAKTPKKWL
jgi:aminobenzoyl-glutamate utilization protein B